MHASGTFTVTTTPEDPSAIAKEADTGRMSIDKTWTGGIAGTSKGEMLTGMTKATGAMSYVAMERVTAVIDGRSGSFLFRHAGSMQANDPSASVLDIAVVPNSGIDGLAGLAGKLRITVQGGVHTYDFEYSLPPAQ